MNTYSAQTKKDIVNAIILGEFDTKNNFASCLADFTEALNQDTIEKYKNQGYKETEWWSSYITEQINEKKQLKIQPHIAHIQFETPSKLYTIYDAEEYHAQFWKRISKNLIMVECVFIAFSTSIFITNVYAKDFINSYLNYARQLGAGTIVMVIVDIKKIEWDEAKYDNIKNMFNSELGLYGYSLDEVFWIALDNLDIQSFRNASQTEINCYKRFSLLETLDKIPLCDKNIEDNLRAVVLKKLINNDENIELLCKIVNGIVKIDDKIILMPNKIEAIVKSINLYTGHTVDEAVAGHYVRIETLGISNIALVNRGDIICLPDSLCSISKTLEAEVDIYKLPNLFPIISAGCKCLLNLHASSEEAIFKQIMKEDNDSDVNNSVKHKTIIKFTRSNTKIWAYIELETPQCFEKYEINKSLGIFSLKIDRYIIGCGKIKRYKSYQKSEDQEYIRVEKEKSKEEVKEEPYIKNNDYDVPSHMVINEEEEEY